MVATTVHSGFGNQENKICHCFHFFWMYLPWSDMTRCHDLGFWILSFKPEFSVSSFTLIKKLFSSSSLSVICCCYCSVAQSCSTLCDVMDCSLPGSSVHGVLQARIILEWVAMPSSRASSWSRGRTCVSYCWWIGLQGDSLPWSHQGSPYAEHMCEMPGWMNHRLESRLLGDMQMIPL